MVLPRSAISLMEKAGRAITACGAAALCGFAGLTKETLAVATGVAIKTPRVLEGGDLVRPGLVVISLYFLNLFLV